MSLDPDALRILHYPAPVLRQRARRIERIDRNVHRVADRMLQLMQEAPGVGLAAPQVGLAWRLFVAGPTTQPEHATVFINPRLAAATRAVADADEGCLSLPEITVNVRRPVGVRIEAINLQGKPFALEGRDLIARIWQHELDHLDGVLIIDRAAQADRIANQRLLRDLEQNYKPAKPERNTSGASGGVHTDPGVEPAR